MFAPVRRATKQAAGCGGVLAAAECEIVVARLLGSAHLLKGCYAYSPARGVQTHANASTYTYINILMYIKPCVSAFFVRMCMCVYAFMRFCGFSISKPLLRIYHSQYYSLCCCCSLLVIYLFTIFHHKQKPLIFIHFRQRNAHAFNGLLMLVVVVAVAASLSLFGCEAFTPLVSSI